MNQFSPGTIVDDRYVIISELGFGGMGCVYQAKEIGLDRTIALKMLHQGLLADDDHRARFIREGKMLAELSHKNVLQFYRLGIWGHTPYIAMEYLQGTTARSLLDTHGQLSASEAIDIVNQACEAMNYIHGAEIIHRDLKPSNIMVLSTPIPNLVKIVDFGLARMLTTEASCLTLTQTGVVVGTVFYLSPEQCQGKRADRRSDIYSMGCILYELLTGTPPFQADNPVALMQLHATAPIPEIADMKLAPGLKNVLQKSMDKDPAHRYQSMFEFKDDLARIQEGRGAEVEPAVVKTKSPRLNKMFVVPAALLVIAATAILVSRLTPEKRASTAFNRPAPDSLSRVQRLSASKALLCANIAMQLAIQQPNLDTAQMIQIDANLADVASRSTSPAVNLQANIVRARLAGAMFRATNHDRWRKKMLECFTRALSYSMLARKPTLTTGVVYAFIGEEFMSLKSYDEAIGQYKTAIEILKTAPPSELELDANLPGSIPGYAILDYTSQIGFCQLQQKKYKEAQASFEYVLEEWPPLFGAALSSAKYLMETLRVGGHIEADYKLINTLEQVALAQREHNALNDDRLASVYAALCMECNRACPNRSMEMAEKAVGLVDGATSQVTLNDVEYCLEDYTTFAVRYRDKALLAGLSQLKSRLSKIQRRKD